MKKRNSAEKVLELDALVESLERLGEKTIVFTGGAFDLFHFGHVTYLERSSDLGDVLVIHIDSDKNVREKKGNQRPIIPEEKRALTVASLGCVDYVFISDRLSHDDSLIEKIRPDILVRVRRDEFTEKQNKKRVEGFKKRHKETRMVFLDPIGGISSTRIIQKIKNL